MTAIWQNDGTGWRLLPDSYLKGLQAYLKSGISHLSTRESARVDPCLLFATEAVLLHSLYVFVARYLVPDDPATGRCLVSPPSLLRRMAVPSTFAAMAGANNAVGGLIMPKTSRKA